MKGGDEGHLLRLSMQFQFQDAVASIAQKRDRQRGEPSAHQLHHLTRPHTNHLVAFAQSRTYRWGCRQHAQKGQGTALLGPGQGDNHGHDDPSESRTAYRSFATGEATVAVMPTFADLAAPAPLQRFIDDQFQRGACLDEGFYNAGEQLTAHGQRRPARSIEHLMERAEVGLPLLSGVAQGSCNGAASMSQQCASQQERQFPPRRSRKQWPKGGQYLYNWGRKGMNLLLDKIVVLITFYLTPEAASCPMLSLKYTK